MSQDNKVTHYSSKLKASMPTKMKPEFDENGNQTEHSMLYGTIDKGYLMKLLIEHREKMLPYKALCKEVGKEKAKEIPRPEMDPRLARIVQIVIEKTLGSARFSGYTPEWKEEFRGRIKLSASHVDNYDQTLSYFRERDFDFKGSEILLECIKIESGSDVFYRINVYVDGRMIGRVSEASDESISMLTDYEYDKAHVKVEEFYHKDGTVMGSNVYLFVHYPGVAPVKISVE